MLTEQSIIDSINILPSGHIEVRRADIILKDGAEVAKTYHRTTINPNDTATAASVLGDKVNIALAAWA